MNKYIVLDVDEWSEAYVVRESGDIEQLYEGHSKLGARDSILEDSGLNIVHRHYYEVDEDYAEEWGGFGVNYVKSLIESGRA